MYPFRTLSPRELYLSRQSANSPSETSSPLFPANTQWDMIFKRRDTASLLNLMLGAKLKVDDGSSVDLLTNTERTRVLSFGGAGLVPTTKHTIIDVKIKLSDVYLQVKQPIFSTKYKRV